MSRARVLIVGGGFAGLACALGLDARRFDVTVVDQRRHFEFIPNIHELISGLKKPADLRLPLSALLRDRGHRFRCARVATIDSAGRSITLANGHVLEGDYLVIACGSADANFGVAGVQRHTLALKSVEDGKTIAAGLRALRKKSGPGRVLVVGAGLAGVEALGEVLRIRGASNWHVQLVEAQDRPLPAAPAAASRFISDACADAGVTLHLGEPVSRVTAKTVVLGGGQRPAQRYDDLDRWPPRHRRYWPTRALPAKAPGPQWPRDLSLKGAQGVFVAGDSAELPRPLSRQAYFALDMGAAVADNIARLESGRRTRVLRALPRPTLLSFGATSAVLIAGRAAFEGKPLLALKEGIYTAVMAQLDRRGAKRRLPALLQRGRTSGAQLWPLLEPRALLTGNGALRRLR